MFHQFRSDISNISIPTQFTCPFYYVPNELCVIASKQVAEYLASRGDWLDELQNGKMFGVLVVATENNELGFLAAFSGQIAGQNIHEYFVPPVFDILADFDFFKKEEVEISALNVEISEIENSEEYKFRQKQLSDFRLQMISILNNEKSKMQIAKQLRDKRRTECSDAQILSDLIRESQFQKAEYKRLERNLNEQFEVYKNAVDEVSRKISVLQQKRKTMSANLQRKIFSQFRFLNALGESKNLCEIFAEAGIEMPPAGAGECAAPRLLQYAFQNHYKPIAMAEFWWGNSPKREIRQHLNFYPACKQKCEPILTFMLRGLDVEPNRLIENRKIDKEIEIIFEDEYLLIINKPSGILSVDGKNEQFSVSQWAKQKYPNIGTFVVHRLDMDTSGLLIIAKSIDVFKLLQKQFADSKIKKQYVAMLDGKISRKSGKIELPLIADIYDRPRQIVDFENGKCAITYFEVDSQIENKTRIKFYPQTGRTHQLRVHSAHSLGLKTPIVGDNLYGKSSDRLYLHAERIEFQHPITKQKIVCECQSPF